MWYNEIMISKENTNELSPEKLKVLMFDYDKAQEMIRHYENLSWQVGAIIFAGLFVMIGAAIVKKPIEKDNTILLFVIVMTLLVDLFWFLWYQRNRILITKNWKDLETLNCSFPIYANFLILFMTTDHSGPSQLGNHF